MTYTNETAERICELIAEGMSLREICRAEGMPGKTTIMRWLADNDTFRDQYARAREAQADHFADEILEIADDGSNDWMLRQQGEVEIEVANHEHISRSKLRVDARKWLMAKVAPKKYGDKIEHEHTGKDGGPIQVTRIERVIVDNASDPDREGIPPASTAG